MWGGRLLSNIVTSEHGLEFLSRTPTCFCGGAVTERMGKENSYNFFSNVSSTVYQILQQFII